MRTINKLFYTIAIVSATFLTSCVTSDLEPSLDQEKELEGNIQTDADLYGLLKGGLNRMTASTYYGRDMIINDECRTDNTFANGNSGRFGTSASFDYNASSNIGVWASAYRVISSANLIINTDLTTITGDIEFAKHLQGQALALRALAHFDLMRNYGQQYVGGNLGVPYVTVFKGNVESPDRLTIDETKAQIYADLDAAFSTMNDAYFDSSKEFLSKQTAKAIESKVATYFGDWDRAKSASESVINSGLYSIIPAGDYVSSFGQDGSSNSIFELAYSDTDNQGINGLGYIYRGDSYGDIEVLDNVLDLYEDGDVRADILGYEFGLLRNMGKYPELNGYDNVNIIRYEEIILNYAEALFETGGDALTQINMLTSMRGASAYGSVTKDDIINERRKELIFEGFRFDDLNRTGKGVEKIDVKQNILESIPAGDHRMALPVPLTEMDANSNMVQNDGY